ncbi:FAD-dependent oxidoreductase [Oceanospirillaceae bacterium]|nr:FAD-dependent oxidoreductase [Oceanospirillaceae bacterium]
MSNAQVLPEKARIAIIGGGIIGTSVAYHLAKRGIKDVVLIERQQLTSGTTWHAAGLVSLSWATPTLTELAKYSHKLYASLEEETGQATGYKRIGSISLARTEARMEEIKRTSSVCKVFGVESEMIDNTRLAELYPGINTDGVLGALYTPGDGQTNPIDTTMALAKGARMNGVEIFENTIMEELLTKDNVITGIRTDKGTMEVDQVILCGGMWTRDIAKTVGVQLPLYACEHSYIVTEEMEGLTQRPVLRDFDRGLYFKEDAGKMLVGWFEDNAIGLPMEKIADDFCFGQFPLDQDHIEPYLLDGMETFPQLQETGIRTWFNGPESFTNDNLHLLGPTPQIDKLFIAAGMNSKGIGAGGGVGKIMADWMIDGYPSGDVSECDIRRHHPAQQHDEYVAERIPESLGHSYAMHWPFYQYQTARDQIQSPLHQELAAAGACFGEVCGHERPNWFANPGQEAKYEYSYKKPNWFENTKQEHMAMREGVGIYDMSSFGKFEVTGPAASKNLQYICAGNIDVPIGKVVYTHFLNARGGIEADITVVRTAKTTYWVITGIGSHSRDWWHLNHRLIDDVLLQDISMNFGGLALQGPLAPSVLAKVTSEDLSHAGFPFGTGKIMEVAGIRMWVQRLTYVGELGWELFIPTQHMTKVYRALFEAGEAFGIRNVGMHAVNSARMEKGFVHWGHDVGPEDNLFEAGLNWAAKPDAGDFIGINGYKQQLQANGTERRLVQFKLDDTEAMLFHNEPIVMDGEIVGYLTSGMYGHSVGSAIGMGYVNVPNLSPIRLSKAKFEIEIALERFPAQASLRGFYDPKGLRPKA